MSRCTSSKEDADSFDALQDPGKAKGSPSIVFAAAAAQLQLRLLETYLLCLMLQHSPWSMLLCPSSVLERSDLHLAKSAQVR